MRRDLYTKAITAGRPKAEPGAPLNVPIHLSSTFHANGHFGYVRDGNPSSAAFEEALGALEGGRALAFGSGIAALNAVLDMVPSGSIVVAPLHAYSGTMRRFTEMEEQGRFQVRRVQMDDASALATAAAGAALLWLESPTNPMMEVCDIRAAVAAGKAQGALVAVDNTFCTPMRQRPLELGADIVMHSATKYIAGHSDALLGALVAATPELHAALAERRALLGAAPGVLETTLALRGLRTLPIRMDRAEATTSELARRLGAHQAVTRVRYPGLAADPGNAVHAQQASGPGAIVVIDCIGTAEAVERMCEGLALWTHATSLGGVESTIERRARWAGESPDCPAGLVRMSVGLEDVDDLWDDLMRGLNSLL
jgi:cystathionine gamma-synthase